MANPLKKTMVYLGLADEEEYDETEAAQEQPARSAREERRERHEEVPAPVTPIRRPAVVRQPAAAAVTEIVTVHPKQYRDAQTIAEHFRDGVPVIMNLSQMSDADARRLIDFASGLSLGLYGRIERVTSKVFLLSPENIAVSGDGTITGDDAITS
ncbi:cell division protein SepF [Microbacterium sediminis]|uniref:Cell division protein SepF n=1 Tax=Microbacterium sediminis TaxID=904291 RepID=A0A1B9N982_9MICO|nr:cell division protein SepF [Microbacterium sediminis]OCG73153.1 cell division protein SepF [Microbacterium sediminis]QBR74502.1 cell division protein SepF [Microbacterium sediminis]